MKMVELLIDLKSKFLKFNLYYIFSFLSTSLFFSMSDVFHTFFGISGLSLMGYLKMLTNPSNNTNGIYRTIDPLYALPVDVVQRLKLQGQVIIPKNDNDDAGEVNNNIFCCDTYDILYL